MNNRERDVNQVLFVTRRFEELKGLRPALVGCVWSVVFGLSLVFDRPGFEGPWLLVSLVAATVAPIGVGIHWIDRHYLARFGRVQQQTQWSARLVIVSSVVTAVGLQAGLGLVPFFTWHATRSLWVALRDAPYSVHHVLGTIAGVTASVLALSGGALGSDRAAVMGFVVLGLGLIPVGLLDHRLLCRTLPGLHRGAAIRATERR